MRVLLTSDLHAKRSWFRWLTHQAPRYGLVVIAGDLILRSIGKRKHLAIDHRPQIVELKAWADEYAASTQTPIAISTGNHDQGRPSTEGAPPQHAGEELWAHFRLKGRQFILDGESRVLGDLVVTVTPFHWDWDNPQAQAAYEAIKKGGAQHAKHPEAAWLLVHHRPPPGRLAAPGPVFPDYGLLKWLERAPCDFLISGHDHDTTRHSGNHVERHWTTWCINAGQGDPTGDDAIPCHAVLDSETRTLEVVDSNGAVRTYYHLAR